MLNKRHLKMILSVIMSFVLVAVMVSCSDKPQEEAPEPEETTETVDYSIYGDESLGIDPKVDESLREWRTILIGGIDNGHRADIQLILCINKESGNAKMTTVSRDTYMQIAHGETVVIDDRELEFCKCNRAFQVGDKYDLMKELNRHMDLNIKEFIGVDWPCTAKLVDALGGVECNIESQSMLDAINKLIASAPEGDAEFIQDTGVQTLTGWQAVQYLRVRKYKGGGSANAREARSREFLSALYERAKGMSAEEIAEVYAAVADDLDTNMSRNTLTDTLAEMSSAQIDNIGGWPYELKVEWEPDEHFNYKVPQTLLSNVVRLHADLFDQFDYEPSATVQELNDRILELEETYLIEK